MAQMSARPAAISDDAYNARLEKIASSPEMREDNITLPFAGWERRARRAQPNSLPKKPAGTSMPYEL